MHITQRLAAARKPVDDTADMHVYEDWMENMKKVADREARLAVKQELDSHEHIVAKCNAEVEASHAKVETANAKASAAERECQSIKGQIAKLERALSTVKSSWDATKEKLSKTSNVTSDDLINEQLKVEQLKLKVANLEGRLIDRKPVKSASVKIPSFDLTPIRGLDGRVQTMKATPVYN